MLTRALTERKIIPTRFSLEIPAEDAANGIYCAMKAELAYRRKKMIFDDSTREHILTVARWVTDTGGKPGLLMLGKPGNGKTTLMRALGLLFGYVIDNTEGHRAAVRDEMVVHEADEIADMCVQPERQGDYKGLFTCPMLGIDDLGAEPTEIMHFGRLYSPLVRLLCKRYDNQLLTVATSNLTGKQLEAKYKSRVYDRLKEMMEVVTFTNESYRK